MQFKHFISEIIQLFSYNMITSRLRRDILLCNVTCVRDVT